MEVPFFYMKFWTNQYKNKISPKHTVFSRIVSAETILFWIWPYVLWPLETVHTGAETIQGRKLLKGGNYSRKYGIPNGFSTLSQALENGKKKYFTPGNEPGISAQEATILSIAPPHHCFKMDEIDAFIKKTHQKNSGRYLQELLSMSV